LPLPAGVLVGTERRPTIGHLDYPNVLVWIAASRSVFCNAALDVVSLAVNLVRICGWRYFVSWKSASCRLKRERAQGEEQEDDAGDHQDAKDEVHVSIYTAAKEEKLYFTRWDAKMD
jgi:hypothetical protein